MKLPGRRLPAVFTFLALSSFLGTTLAANELVPLNEFAAGTDYSQNFTVSAGWDGLNVTHDTADDGGIGRGGFVTLPSDTGATSNLIYDTDGGWGTQAFGDATITIDNYAGSSIGFIVRGNASRSDSIRVLLTSRARVRVWTGGNPSEAGTSGTLAYDATGPAAGPRWNHLRLSVRNGGDGGDQIEMLFQIYHSQARFDATTLAAEHTVLLSVENSVPYLAAGEIGFNMFGVGNRIDNFAVYEHGTAPANLPHPDLADFFPVPNAQYHVAADGFSFRAKAASGIDTSDIYVTLNDVDVSGALVISGDPEDRSIHYSGLDPDLDYVAKIEVVAGSGEITTREIAFSTTAPPTPAPLIAMVEFEDEADFTGNFTTLTGPIAFAEEWDGGIGRGGFVRGTNTSNTVYDPDGTGDTQTFQDFTATMDHRPGGSMTFLIRGNRALDQSIRVTLTNRNRMRVWSGSSLATGTSGPLEFDETISSELSGADWVHLRLDVRNVGEEWDRQIEIRLRAFGSQTDLVAPGFDLTYTLPSGPSFAHLEAGEVGFRTGGGTNDIDNFAVYEYGTGPAHLTHPEIRDILPAPGTPEIPDNSPLSFTVTGIAATPQAGIVAMVNGADASEDLLFTGDESHWFVTYPFLNPGDDVLIEATSEGATTSIFFDYPPLPNPFDGRLRDAYDSGGFQDDGIYPLGDLLNVQHGGGEWTPHATAPAQILEVEEPFDKVMRMSTRQWLSFPEVNSGIVTLDLDLRVSSPDVRTLDLSFTTAVGSGVQRSFLGWGTVAGQFTYYDGSSWVPLLEPGTEWRHYRMVNYLSGAYTSSYDLFVDGVLVGEKLPFRSTFNPDLHVVGAIRLHASSGENYVELDNVTLKAQPLLSSGQLPFPTIDEIAHDGAGASISFETYLGYNYVVEYRDALGTGGWIELTSLSGTGAAVVANDPGASGNRRFYRVKTVNQ